MWYTSGGVGLVSQNFSLGYFMFEVLSKIQIEIPISQLNLEICFKGKVETGTINSYVIIL